MIKIKVNYIEINESRQLLVQRKYPQWILFLWKMSKYLQTSLAAMAHLAEGLCFNALLTLKVENSFVGTRIPTVSKMEGQFILPLKTFIRNKALRCRSLE
jgi:hypothetical protein